MLLHKHHHVSSISTSYSNGNLTISICSIIKIVKQSSDCLIKVCTVKVKRSMWLIGTINEDPLDYEQTAYWLGVGAFFLSVWLVTIRQSFILPKYVAFIHTNRGVSAYTSVPARNNFYLFLFKESIKKKLPTSFVNSWEASVKIPMLVKC